MATQLRRQGVGPAEIGVCVGSFYLPWAFKWAFGPLIDTFGSERLGRRRGWILFTQIAMALTLLATMGLDLLAQLWRVLPLPAALVLGGIAWRGQPGLRSAAASGWQRGSPPPRWLAAAAGFARQSPGPNLPEHHAPRRWHSRHHERAAVHRSGTPGQPVSRRLTRGTEATAREARRGAAHPACGTGLA